MYIEKKEVYIISTSQKKKVHIVSTSLVLLSFLLGSPNLLFYLIIFFLGFLSITCLDIHKNNNSGKLYIHIVANVSQRKLKT